jgi:hypothetical protein
MAQSAPFHGWFPSGARKFLQQVLAGHRPQSTEAERLRDQGRDPRKFQGNTRAVLQLLTLISRHRPLSRWGPFLDAVNVDLVFEEQWGNCRTGHPNVYISDGRGSLRKPSHCPLR